MARRHRRPEFSVGKVLSRSIRIWLRNFIPFTLMIAIVQIPMALYTYWFVNLEEATELQRQVFDRVNEYGHWMLTLIVTGALAYGVFEQLGGTRPGLGKCLRVGLARLGPVLGVGLIVGLAWSIPMVVAELIHPLARIAGAIPAIFLFCMLYVAVPATVIERPGVIGALKRSIGLTHGSKGSIFLVNLVLGLMQIVLGIVMVMVVMSSDSETAGMDWLVLAIAILFSGLPATTSAVVYHDLRVAKEGIGIEELTSVFA
ncbi:MAG: DUF6159 family protein [Planctomycetota bacterium]|jgi:hypothetical protein